MKKIQLANAGLYVHIHNGPNSTIYLDTTGTQLRHFSFLNYSGQVSSAELTRQLNNSVRDFCINQPGGYILPKKLSRFIIEGPIDDKLSTLFRELYRVTETNLFLLATRGKERERIPRKVWEERAFQQGFLKHFKYYKYLDIYETILDSSECCFIPLQKIPEYRVKGASLSSLEQEKMLHMDMLRVPGRRSDAHCIRYFQAAKYIRKNDAVLDVACGYGYGSFIVFQNSYAKNVLGLDLSEKSVKYAQQVYSQPGLDFRRGDAQNLVEIPDDSIDFILSFETIEHLPEPQRYLKELFRVLAPAGRVFISAPNKWINEEGVDPNPDHLHIYDWEKLRGELKDVGFIIEKAFGQTAGGALKHPDAMPSFFEWDVEAKEPEVSEWVCFLGIKSPILGRNKKNTVREDIPDDKAFNLLSFNRDYLNPYLLPGMVTRGERINNPKELINIQLEILEKENNVSPDYGAAICGLIYSQINSRRELVDAAFIRTKVENFLSIRSEEVHIVRWQISISYAFGLLNFLNREFKTASDFWKRCFYMDPSVFSPLLQTKVLDSALGLALIELENDIEKSKAILLRSISLTEKIIKSSWLNVLGSSTSPLALGLAELAEVLDKASRNAYLLDVLKHSPERAGLVQDNCFGFTERNLLHLQQRGDLAERVNESLVQSINSINNKNISLVEEINHLYNKNVELAGECQSLNRLNEHFQKENRELKNQVGAGGEKQEVMGEREANPATMQLIYLQNALREERENKKELLRFIRKSFEEEQDIIRQFSHKKSSRFAKLLSALNNYREAGFNSLAGALFHASRSLIRKTPFAPNFGLEKEMESCWNKRKNGLEEFAGAYEELGPLDIIIQVDNFVAGGLENVVLEQALYFKNKGLNVLVLVLEKIGEAYIKAENLGLKIKQLSYEEKRYKRILLTSHAKIVFAHCSFYGCDVANFLGIPFVQVVHNLYIWTRDYPEIKQRIVNSLPFTTFVVGVSDRVTDFFCTEYGMERSKTSSILNGIDSHKFKFSEERRKILRKKLGLKDTDFVCLSSASISLQKNHVGLIKAFAIARRAKPNLKLISIGKVYDQKILDEVNSIIKKENLEKAVFLQGLVEDPQDYYSASDVLVQSSFYEGCSLSVLEALANSLPVVASEISVTPEMKSLGVVWTVNSPIDIEELTMASLGSSVKQFEKNFAEAIVSVTELKVERGEVKEKFLSKERCFEDYLNLAHKLCK